MYRQTYVMHMYKLQAILWLYTARIERLFNPAKDISAVSITEFGKPEC